MRVKAASRRCLDIPLGRAPRGRAPTWGVVAARYERCRRRAAFYVGRRVRDGSAAAGIADEVLERNVDLLLAPHDELEELRRLRATAERLIAATRAAAPPGARG